MTEASDNYERFTHRVIDSLVDYGVEVHRQKTYTGRLSQRDIKVDVSFNYTIAEGANVLFLVECKCYSHRVPVDDVEAFHSKLDDIGAHKGIMVTTVGFQDGAVKTAQGRGIALALLTTEPQKGELTYITNAANDGNEPQKNTAFWQGNYRGPLDNYDGGYRFDSMAQFLGMLCYDALEEQRQRQIAAFEREHGGR
ncbi:Restriction endonuclease [Gimesia panareensis]|uniref:Restriction endonuclease n=1 Tax=Gimesia panareensis TaxID=2527978 RepID=A0A517Q0H4_9PLAN|nr:restriction endonuclease [Gimesia panareensis]QDT25122.1 Restriction endonuclease [Gimesia panareensis]